MDVTNAVALCDHTHGEMMPLVSHRVSTTLCCVRLGLDIGTLGLAFEVTSGSAACYYSPIALGRQLSVNMTRALFPNTKRMPTPIFGRLRLSTYGHSIACVITT